MFRRRKKRADAARVDHETLPAETLPAPPSGPATTEPGILWTATQRLAPTPTAPPREPGSSTGSPEDSSTAHTLIQQAREQAREVLLLADEEIQRQQAESRKLLQQAEQETAWLRRSAREHATQVEAQAGASADLMLREAETTALEMTAQAEASATEMKQAAKEILDTARRDAEALRSQAADELRAAREMIEAPLRQLSFIRDLSRSFLAELEQASELLSTSTLLRTFAVSETEQTAGAERQGGSSSLVRRAESDPHAIHAAQAPPRSNGHDSASALSGPAAPTATTRPTL